MKKIVIITAVMALTSACKKDYTCECVESPGNSVSKYTIKSVSKERAKANCVSTSEERNGVLYQQTCSLK